MATTRRRRAASAGSGNSSAHPSALVHPSSSQNLSRELMTAALAGSEVSIDIPDTATLQDVEKYVGVCIEGQKRLTSASLMLSTRLGHLLVHIDAQNLYKPMFNSFSAYLEERIQKDFGYAAPTAWEAIRLVRKFPTADVSAYSVSTVKLASQMTDETKPDFRDVLTKLSRMPILEGRKWVQEQKRLAASTGTDSANGPQSIEPLVSLTIRISKDFMSEFSSIADTYKWTHAELLRAALDAFRESKGIRDEESAASEPPMIRRVPVPPQSRAAGGR